MIALTCHSYGWAPTVALDQTPRALSFYAGEAQRFRLLAQRDMLLAFHAAKPQDLLNDLIAATEPPKAPEDPLVAMARLAEATGDTKAAYKMRRVMLATRILERLKGGARA